MQKLPAFLSLCLALVACRKEESPVLIPAPASTVADTVQGATAPPPADTALHDTATAPPATGFDRIPIERIDSALAGYDAGDTLSADSVENNECLGMPVMRYRMASHLVLEGHTYNAYACTWRFSGPFRPVMGLAPGMSKDAVLQLLGRPRESGADTLIYLSKKPDDYDSSYFDSRWELRLHFRKDRLRNVLFVPFFDDC